MKRLNETQKARLANCIYYGKKPQKDDSFFVREAEEKYIDECGTDAEHDALVQFKNDGLLGTSDELDLYLQIWLYAVYCHSLGQTDTNPDDYALNFRVHFFPNCLKLYGIL